MKKNVLALSAALLLGLCACGGEETAATPAPAAPSQAAAENSVPSQIPSAAEGSKYTFSVNGCKLPMNAEFGPFLSYLGEPDSYFEAESCAFNGLDKTYDYPGFDLVTYPVEETDYISDIYFLDSTVSTPEGITIGSTLEDVITAYGEDHEEDLGLYQYTDGDTQLSFLIEDGKVRSVEYLALNGLIE